MADYFTVFSVEMKLQTPAEKNWCRKRLEKLSEQEDPDTGSPKIDCLWSFTEQGDLWFRSEDGHANIDQIAKFVQAFLKKFHPDKWWYLEWSNWCSRMRLDGFGGGAILVTAQKIEGLNSYDWVMERAAYHRKKSKLISGLNGEP